VHVDRGDRQQQRQNLRETHIGQDRLTYSDSRPVGGRNYFGAGEYDRIALARASMSRPAS